MRCEICPRRCNAERTAEKAGGVCRMPAGLVVARAMLHMWEEPVLSGKNGAGCIFFSGCNLGCVFCQNGRISHENFGKVITPAHLREIMEDLVSQGAHCIDLVTPTHFTPWVLEALRKPLPVPVVWNSGGYERVETLRTLEGKVQIYLPDLKYAMERPARELSAAEQARAEDRAAKAADRLAAEKKPTPPAPTSMLVDEKVVEAKREAVRALRDDTTAQGRAFHENVSLGLGAWIDPANPGRKYFRIVVSSRAEKPLPVVSKDMVFLMDASGSIANDRLKACRKAVSTALRLLNTGDRFNVIAFRDKFSYAFPETAWMEVSQEAFEKADAWMARLTAHGQTDVFRTLRGVLAMPRDPSRPVVALVITDGEATSGMTRSAEIISKFSELNGGLISIFMYGVKGNANAYLMDMLTRCNRGTWARHEGLRWSAAAGIPALAMKFQRPVLADISVLFSASSRAETYPQLVSNLCEDEPIEIYGSCPADQKDLVFSLRGLNGAMVFENMFRLPFAKAEKMGPEVKTAWAQRRLYALIAAYTARPDARLLKDLRAFADAYQIQIPYEREMR